MSWLAGFSSEETELLVSLPYRVGIWISDMEDQDGDQDDDHESTALVDCLRKALKDNKGKLFITQILEEILRSEEKWPRWADTAQHVLADIKKALPLLRQKKMSTEDIRVFKRLLMGMGTNVAQASNEYASYEEAGKKGFFGKIIGKFSNKVGDPMNVSAAEDPGLAQLRATLQEMP